MNLRIGLNSIPFNPQVRFSGQPQGIDGPEGPISGVGDNYGTIGDPKSGIDDRNPNKRFPYHLNSSGSPITADTFTASSGNAKQIEIDGTQD
jgi:hypothetical protein